MVALPSAQIESAIARLPEQASKAIEQVLANARATGAERLIAACEAELRIRGSLKLTNDQAKHMVSISARTEGKPVGEVIEIAFHDQPARPEEIRILQCIARQPGISHAELTKLHGKKDLSLVIGHLIYDRFGYFRPLLNGGAQSDLLLERDTASGKVCYALRPEAAAAFSALGLLDE